ncbi:hypothetical protein ACTFIW_000324 [Dictyostelium discoideum]
MDYKNKNNENCNKVAIIGIGFRFPNLKGDLTPNGLWGQLLNKYDGIVKNDRWNESFYKTGDIPTKNAGLIPFEELKSFDPLFFGINPSEVIHICPQQRILLKCTWEALEDSGIDPIEIRGSNTSVFLGCSNFDYQNLNKNNNKVQQNIFASSSHSVSNRISYCFDLHGESMTLDTACSSSSNAIRRGYKSIVDGSSNISVVGGINILLDPNTSKSYSQLNMLSKDGKCKTFDADADGYVRSESAGIAILKNLNDAIKDGNNIYCVIDGSASNVDGNGFSDKSNFYSPSKSSQVECIRLALESTNGEVNENDIVYFEAHGTGTPTGDPIELESVSISLKTSENRSSDNPLLIGSFKPNIGHSECASGISSLIKCCLILKNQRFVPNINYNKPNPNIKFDQWKLKVVTDPIDFSTLKISNKPISIAINNFGVTGSNCCLIISSFKGNQIINNNKSKSPKQYLIPFSTNSIKSLDLYKSRIDNKVEFKEFAENQIKSKSKKLIQRSVVIASNWDEFNLKSNTINTSNDKLTSNMLVSSNKKNATMIFVFCGQGAQYSTMAKNLYDSEPIFKKSMDKIDSKLSEYYGFSILEKLRSFNENDLKGIQYSIIAQPSTCMVQISLFELYCHWGIKPSIIVGHSLGEISSSYCSGMIDLDTFCYLIYHRSMVQSKTNGLGRMLSISIGENEYNSKYSSRYPELEIACYNSPSSIVIAGKELILNEIIKELKQDGVFCTILGSPTSFHTSSQIPVKDEILKITFKSKQSTYPIFSTVTTNLYDEKNPFDTKYVYDNIINPVKFTNTISNIYKHIELNNSVNNNSNEIIFIEIAPHPTLSFYLKQMVPEDKKQSVSIFSPLSKKKPNDLLEIQKLISELYCLGYNGIDFNIQLSNLNDNVNIQTTLNLPLYQWEEQEYWKLDNLYQHHLSNGPSINHLGISNSNHTPYLKSYQTHIDIQKKPFQWLKGHQIKGKYYFPGCGYIDNILKIFGDNSESTTNPNKEIPDILISFIEFKTPLIFMDGINQCLQTNIHSTGKKEYKALFHFKDEKSSSDWIQTSTANFQLFSRGHGLNEDNEESLFKYNINDLISNQCNLTKLSKQELYSHIKTKCGLNYSGDFQRVEKCYFGNNCSLSEISLSQGVNENRSTFFDSSIIDCCLHGSIGLIDENCQLVFEKLEGLTYYSSKVPTTTSQHSKIYVYSKLKPRVGDSYSASIIVMLENGTVLFEMENASFKSTTKIKDSLAMEYPTNEIYSCYLQSKDSLIPSLSSFDHIFKRKITDEYVDQIKIYESFIPKLLFSNINKRCPEITIDEIQSSEIEQLLLKYYKIKEDNDNKWLSRLFTFAFESIKQWYHCEDYDFENVLSSHNFKIFSKSTKIISKLLFPLENDNENDEDSPQSLFEGGLLDKFYTSGFSAQNEIIGEIIQESIKPILNEKLVFRILEFGGGVGSLSLIVLEKINSLLIQYPNYQIDIEYTWSDISPSFITEAKVKFEKFNDRVNIIYKALNLEQPLIGEKQGLKPQYYDYIIMFNVLHVIKDVKYGVEQIYQLLVPNGNLLFIEPIYKSIVGDGIFGVFDQWWSFQDTEIRKDRCCMNQQTWYKLLKSVNFNDDIKMTPELTCFVIQAQKPSISNLSFSKSETTTYDNIIVFGNKDDSNLSNNFIKSIDNGNLQIISTIDEFNKITKYISNESIIYFIKSIDELSVDNFVNITHEYTQINQKLMELNSKCKHVLITNDSTTTNYLSSSLIGAARYYHECPLELFILNFDTPSIIENQNLFKTIEPLINSSINIQREFIINNHKVYYERIKNETNLKSIFKNSSSFESLDQVDNFMISLTPNLEYKLKTKPTSILKKNEVEIKVLSTGLNYKDYLIYAGLVESVEPIFGIEFSGIVTNIGSGNNEFKVGDSVYGTGKSTTSSHIITDIDVISHKPSNISHSEASSIPVVYLTSYHSLYNIGALKNNETILIHSATGGVGLSTLEILKWKGHSGLIFVTVGSNEKEEYLKENYGDMISGIFSTRNKNFVKQIKSKIIELNPSGKSGVDFILNTLSSSDYMDSNFKCLNMSGRIVDLSITHLNSNEFTDNKKFKYNYGYHNIELQYVDKKIIKSTLSIISNAISSNDLQLIPITEYSIENVKDSVEFINERVHMGKIVVDHENQESIIDELIEKQKSIDKFDQSIFKQNYKLEPSLLGKNILITGQSGIVLEILKWILRNSKNNSIDNIIIFSKSSIKWEMELLINKSKLLNSKPINSMGNYLNNIKFHFKSVDISNSELTDKAINQLLIENPDINNIDSIFHFAYLQATCNSDEVDLHHLTQSHSAKSMGAINLHNQSIKRNWKIINFIMSSSITSKTSSANQCGYISSNNVLDSLSKYRISIGLPTICTNYGLIQSTGFVSRNESVAALLNGEGLLPISTNLILGTLDLQLQNQKQSSNLILSNFNFTSLNGLPQKSLISKFDYQININEENEKSKSLLKDDNVELTVDQLITFKISELLSTDILKLNKDIILVDYGVDSLVIIQLKNWVDKEFSIPNALTIQQVQNSTINSFIQLVKNSIDKKNKK